MLINKVCLNKICNMLFFMNWIRFTNRLFGARIQINEPNRVQFETNEPLCNQLLTHASVFFILSAFDLICLFGLYVAFNLGHITMLSVQIR